MPNMIRNGSGAGERGRGGGGRGDPRKGNNHNNQWELDTTKNWEGGGEELIYIDNCPVSNSNNDNIKVTKAGKGCRNNCKKNISAF